MKQKAVVEASLPFDELVKEREGQLGKEVAHAAIKLLAADPGERVAAGKVEGIAAYRTGLFHLAGDDPKKRRFLNIMEVLQEAFGLKSSIKDA